MTEAGRLLDLIAFLPSPLQRQILDVLSGSAMTAEELMRPRYEPIFNVAGKHYPASLFTGGEMIELVPNGNTFWGNQGAARGLLKDFFDAFPNLFKPLPWYANRAVSDMPEYVRETKYGGIYKFVDFTPFGVIVKTNKGETYNLLVDVIQPATQQDFEQSLESKA